MSTMKENPLTDEIIAVARDDEEYMLEPVPKSSRRSTWGLVAIWISFGFVVTGLIVGGQLAGQGGGAGMPLGLALATIATGELFLFGLTILIGYAAMKTGFNLALLARFSFGSIGFVLPMAVMALLTLGWFASILGMIGEVWGVLLHSPTGITVIDPAALGRPDIPPISLEVALSCLVFGALFTWTAYRGISAIEKVAIPVAPFVLIVSVLVGIAMVNEYGGWTNVVNEASKQSGLGFGTGVTIVIGAWVAGAIMGADILRFAKNFWAVVAGAAACFVFTNPLLNVIGYIGTLTTGDSNFVNWMYQQGIFLAIIGVIVWTTSLWTTNNSELYSNSLYTGPALHSLGITIKRKKIVLVVGIVGTILGALGFYQLFFSDFITVLGAAFVPLAGPIIADYYFLRRKEYTAENCDRQPPMHWPGVIAFLIGATCGIIFQYWLPLPGGFSSGVAALLITIIAHLLLHPVFATHRKTSAS